MFIFRAFIVLAVVGIVQCITSAADFQALIASRTQNQFVALVDNAYKSSFKPVDSLMKAALATTPYSTTGFVMMTTYEGTYGAADYTCSTPTFVSAFPINSCITTSSYAFKLQITGDDCYSSIIQYFGDAACTNFLGTSNLQGYTDFCSLSTAPYLSGLGHNVYHKIECTNSAKPITPTVAVTTEAFGTAQCGGAVKQYVAYSANACMYVAGTTIKFFCDTSGAPMYSIYQGANDDCSVTAAHTGYVDSGCQLETDDGSGDDDDYVPSFINPPPSISSTMFPTPATPAAEYTITYCPSQAPTLKPAFAPTIFPTSATLQAVSFSASQNIDGITATLFNGASVNKATLMETIASTMTGVSALDIGDLSVKDASRRRLASMDAQAVSSITASYSVKTTTTLSASQLYYELSTAVESGAFNTALNSYATGAGALALVGCTSSSMNEGGGGGSDSLSTGALIGVIVGSVAGFCLIVGICVAMFCMCAKPAKPMASQHGDAPPSNQA